MFCFKIVAQSGMWSHVEKYHQDLEESQCPQCCKMFRNVYFTKQHQKQVHDRIFNKSLEAAKNKLEKLKSRVKKAEKKKVAVKRVYTEDEMKSKFLRYELNI